MSADRTPAAGAAPDPRPLLVTSALPYANGPLHFGHIAGAYLPADLFVRWHRLAGSDVVFICGTDEHGVAITVNAEREGRGYQEYVDHWHGEIKSLFDRFAISFDHFSRTSRREPHYALSQEFFLRLLREKHVAPKAEQQHFCVTDKRFLPDRYVTGTCYVCGAKNARGDECKTCGSWLEALRLIDPHCATCGNPPEIRDTMQYELDLAPLSRPDVQPKVLGNMLGWFARSTDAAGLKHNVRTAVLDKLLVEGDGLHARPITRDLPWGVPVPELDLEGHTVAGHDGKVLYVWFDAPIGYISATIEWAAERAARGHPGRKAHAVDDWRRYWITQDAEGATETAPRLYHFIGKDNIPFHCIVFPAMLAWQGQCDVDQRLHDPATPGGRRLLGPGLGERWVLPDNVPANEFYNLEGRKFSTSDRWTLDNERMFELFGVDALRWYLTVSMPETSDSQFTFAGLATAVNKDLADVLGNYASRVLKFVQTHLGGSVPAPDRAWNGGELARVAAERAAALERTGAALARCEFRAAADAFLALGRYANQLFDTHVPWKLRKTDLLACGSSLCCHVQIVTTLSVLMAPFMPGASARLRRMLDLPDVEAWTPTGLRAPLDAAHPDELPGGHALGEPGILFTKIPDEVIERERAALAAQAAAR